MREEIRLRNFVGSPCSSCVFAFYVFMDSPCQKCVCFRPSGGEKHFISVDEYISELEERVVELETRVEELKCLPF
jgi:hypothetical protein